MITASIHRTANTFIPGIQDLATFSLRLGAHEQRDLCWQSQSEFGMVVSGAMSLTGIDPDGRQVAEVLQAGDTWFFSTGAPHWVKGLESGCEFIVCCDARFEQMPVPAYGHA
jgi:hypothetical protein